jgi:cyanate lyase
MPKRLSKKGLLAVSGTDFLAGRRYFPAFSLSGRENAETWHGYCCRARVSPAGSQAMTRDEVTRKILAAKRVKSLSWKTIVAEIGGGSAVYLTAALMGQMKLRPEQAERAAKLLDLDEEETTLLQEIPHRGSPPTAVPTDPLIYRFYELVQVYGTTWKELIQEEFGDGIMSAIDFDMTIERQPDPKGDRVKLTLSGKFLPYKEY